MNTYSGKFVLRLPEAMHRKLAKRARLSGFSLNRVCVELLKQGMDDQQQDPQWLKDAYAVSPLVKKKFGASLIGILAFGSQVNGQAREQSDLDLLIVIENTIPIVRSLYRWWEESVPIAEQLEINPHFVHVSADTPSGLWLEAALNHHMIYKKGQKLDKVMMQILERIREGQVERHWSNGHPYWSWSKNAE
jgi:predicted nucleotidyltransferase